MVKSQMMQPKTKTLNELYKDSGLIYIRYHARIEEKPNGQKKIGGNRPAFSKIQQQLPYKKGDGEYFSLLMGREYKPGRWAVLLDFDNKEDENCKSGLELAKLLNMDQYGAPKQTTPSGGLHYIFYVDSEQASRTPSPVGVVHNGVKYNMDVKFRNGLCNCQPSKIENYGSYKWVNPGKLLNIPKLPPAILDMISTKPTPSPRTPNPRAPMPVPPPAAPGKLDEKQLHDVRSLCSCVSLSMLDDYWRWTELGMILKEIGAPVSVWEEASRRSHKFRPGECGTKWRGFRSSGWSMRSLVRVAKEGNLDLFSRLLPTLHMCKDMHADDERYDSVELDARHLTTKSPKDEMTEAQRDFKRLTDTYLDDPTQKCLVVRSRYGSGKTTFLQRMLKERDPKRVLFITYRQTLARDIMRNFGKLGFQNYLDSHEKPGIWSSPRLIVQLDSLLNLVLRNERVMQGETFDMNYDMIILDESESLLSHFDCKTMERKNISVWNFFDLLLKHSKKVLLMDGDASERTLSFAKAYGEMTYIHNTNTEGRRVMNVLRLRKTWEKRLHEDIERFSKEDPRFRICVVSQSASEALGLAEELRRAYPKLVVKSLVGADSGETKRQMLSNINETLKDTNIFIYSPVLEAGVDITVKVKKNTECCAPAATPRGPTSRCWPGAAAWRRPRWRC